MKLDKRKIEIMQARACMNTDDLYKATKMPRATLSRAIVGKNVTPATAGRLASALGVDVTEILADE